MRTESEESLVPPNEWFTGVRAGTSPMNLDIFRVNTKTGKAVKKRQVR